jgi:hypothetical protein
VRLSTARAGNADPPTISLAGGLRVYESISRSCGKSRVAPVEIQGADPRRRFSPSDAHAPRARRVSPKAKRLFMIDGAKALRAGINKVFGPQHPVQRCRNHKIRNVVERLPEEQKDQVKVAMRATVWMRKKASPRCASWPTGWTRSSRRQPTVCGRGCRNASRSIAWACRPRCTAAWRRRS